MSKRNHLPDSWGLVPEAQKVFLVKNTPGFLFFVLPSSWLYAGGLKVAGSRWPDSQGLFILWYKLALFHPSEVKERAGRVQPGEVASC